MPAITFIRVDLPAPFSPTTARHSPADRRADTPSRATTPGNALRTSRATSSGAGTDYFAPSSCFWSDSLNAATDRVGELSPGGALPALVMTRCGTAALVRLDVSPFVSATRISTDL